MLHRINSDAMHTHQVFQAAAVVLSSISSDGGKLLEWTEDSKCFSRLLPQWDGLGGVVGVKKTPQNAYFSRVNLVNKETSWLTKLFIVPPNLPLTGPCFRLTWGVRGICRGTMNLKCFSMYSLVRCEHHYGWRPSTPQGGKGETDKGGEVDVGLSPVDKATSQGIALTLESALCTQSRVHACWRRMTHSDPLKGSTLYFLALLEFLHQPQCGYRTSQSATRSLHLQSQSAWNVTADHRMQLQKCFKEVFSKGEVNVTSAIHDIPRVEIMFDILKKGKRGCSMSQANVFP